MKRRKAPQIDISRTTAGLRRWLADNPTGNERKRETAEHVATLLEMMEAHPAQQYLVDGVTTNGTWDLTSYDPGAGAASQFAQLLDRHRRELDAVIDDAQRLGTWWKERHGEDLLAFDGEPFTPQPGGGPKLAWVSRYAKAIHERVTDAHGIATNVLARPWRRWTAKATGRPKDTLVDVVVNTLDRAGFSDAEIGKILAERPDRVRDRIKRLRRLLGERSDPEDRGIVEAHDGGERKFNLVTWDASLPPHLAPFERLGELAKRNNIFVHTIYLYLYDGMRGARKPRSWLLYGCQTWLDEYRARKEQEAKRASDGGKPG